MRWKKLPMTPKIVLIRLIPGRRLSNASLQSEKKFRLKKSRVVGLAVVLLLSFLRYALDEFSMRATADLAVQSKNSISTMATTRRRRAPIVSARRSPNRQYQMIRMCTLNLAPLQRQKVGHPGSSQLFRMILSASVPRPALHHYLQGLPLSSPRLSHPSGLVLPLFLVVRLSRPTVRPRSPCHQHYTLQMLCADSAEAVMMACHAL